MCEPSEEQPEGAGEVEGAACNRDRDQEQRVSYIIGQVEMCYGQETALG